MTLCQVVTSDLAEGWRVSHADILAFDRSHLLRPEGAQFFLTLKVELTEQSSPLQSGISAISAL